MNNDKGKTVLGLGGSGHEWASCAINSKTGLVGIAEERVCRSKYGLGTDLLAADSRKACLEHLGISAADIDHAVACSLVPRTFYHGVREKITIINHHLAHAYSSFYGSGFKRSAVLVADNSGSILSGSTQGTSRKVETISFFIADREKGIDLIHRIEGEHRLEVEDESDYFNAGETSNSIGHLYRTASIKLGFFYKDKVTGGIFSEDGKTMGLAPFGDGRYVEKLAEFVYLGENGQVEIPLDGLSQTLDFCIGKGSFEERAALAYAVQYHTERIIMHCVDFLYKKTGCDNICIAGGVGLNSVANGIIQQKSEFKDVYVASAPSDDGVSLGCAYYGMKNLCEVNEQDIPSLTTAYLGPDHSDEEIDSAIRQHSLQAFETENISKYVADLLHRECYVGVYSGRSEFGPRALGNRTILASPYPAQARDKLNHVLKKREWFRPYGMIIKETDVELFFEKGGPSPYMSFVGKLKEGHNTPAVAHFDGTARYQTINREMNPFIYDVITYFGELSDVPAIINTSFNSAGEPIVETAFEAIESAIRLSLDFLVMGEKLVVLSEKGKLTHENRI